MLSRLLLDQRIRKVSDLRFNASYCLIIIIIVILLHIIISCLL